MVKHIATHPERCLGCATCVIECSMAHTSVRTPAESLCAEERPQPRIHVESVDGLGVPLQCHHCDDAVCMDVCPTDAIYRSEDGATVFLETQLCVGCRLCQLVCPYGVIDTVRGHTAVLKCDHCAQPDEPEHEPACVAGCPTGALTFEEVSERERELGQYVMDDILLDAPLKTLRLTHDEYLTRAFNQSLPIGTLNAAVNFVIDEELCKACGKCLKTCPADGIAGEKKVPHVINQEMCLHCGQCRENCPFDAVDTTWDTEIEIVLCSTCGRPFTTLRDFETARSRVGEHVVMGAICPPCRRTHAAELLLETSKTTASIGN